MRAILVPLVCLSAVACTRVVVHKDPGEHDKGIRYYRPKPYLFIVPDGGGGGGKAAFTVTQGAPLKIQQETTASAAAGDAAVRQAAYQAGHPQQPAAPQATPTPAGPSLAPSLPVRPQASGGGQEPTKISISMMYMPDFAEEYSIQLRPGLGIGELNVKLDNGWNLTSVGIKTDQQTDEIIKSTADLIGSLGKLKPQGFREGQPEDTGVRVLATNVPFGFYEAVIAHAPNGKKQLYGWRYIGFMPFQACPVEPAGGAAVCCGDPNAVYGLVMDKDGILRFEPIGAIPILPTAVRGQ